MSTIAKEKSANYTKKMFNVSFLNIYLIYLVTLLIDIRFFYIKLSQFKIFFIYSRYSTSDKIITKALFLL